MEMDRAEGGTMAAAVFPSPNSQQQGIGEYSDRFGIPLLKGSANFPFAPDLGFLLSLNAGNLLYLLTSKIRCVHSASDNVFQSLDLLSRFVDLKVCVCTRARVGCRSSVVVDHYICQFCAVVYLAGIPGLLLACDYEMRGIYD